MFDGNLSIICIWYLTRKCTQIIFYRNIFRGPGTSAKCEKVELIKASTCNSILNSPTLAVHDANVCVWLHAECCKYRPLDVVSATDRFDDQPFSNVVTPRLVAGTCKAHLSVWVAPFHQLNWEMSPNRFVVEKLFRRKAQLVSPDRFVAVRLITHKSVTACLSYAVGSQRSRAGLIITMGSTKGWVRSRNS